jgi:hypothetical protein
MSETRIDPRQPRRLEKNTNTVTQPWSRRHSAILGLLDRGDAERHRDLVTDEQVPRAERLVELHVEV